MSDPIVNVPELPSRGLYISEHLGRLSREYVARCTSIYLTIEAMTGVREDDSENVEAHQDAVRKAVRRMFGGRIVHIWDYVAKVTGPGWDNAGCTQWSIDALHTVTTLLPYAKAERTTIAAGVYPPLVPEHVPEPVPETVLYGVPQVSAQESRADKIRRLRSEIARIEDQIFDLLM